MSDQEDKFDVTIKGQIIGANIPTAEQVLKLIEKLQNQEKEILDLMKEVKEKKEILSVINARIDRIESFLSSFMHTK